MFLSAMGAWVTRLLNQIPSVSNFYLCADLSAVINQACLDVAMDTLGINTYGSVWTVSGTDTYPLSASYMTNSKHITIRSVTYDSFKLRQASIDDACWQYGTTKASGVPSAYRIVAGSIETDVYPIEAKELKVYFYKRPETLLNNGDDPLLPEEYSMPIIYRACAYLTCKDSEDLKENRFFQMYGVMLSSIRGLKMGLDTYNIGVDPLTVSMRKHNY